MDCNEQLYLDGEDYSSRDCQLKLGHDGDHEYYGKKFPRPEPADGLDSAITDLIEQAAAASNRAWDLDERQFPIVVEVTSVYIIKVSAATEDEALKYWADSGDYPDVDGEHCIDGGFEFRRIDNWQRRDMTGAPFGPKIACPGCGTESMDREWYHDPFRKCHGPIQWRENVHARALQWRYSREFKSTPFAVTA